MGKIVKYCADCEESFAEKFSFCPNCAAALTAYEMNPLAAAAPVSEQVKTPETAKTTAPVAETPIFNKTDDYKTQIDEPVKATSGSGVRAENISAEDEKIFADTPPFAAKKTFENETPAINPPKSSVSKTTPITIVPAAVAPSTVDDYRRTYIADNTAGKTNGKQSFADGAAKKAQNAATPAAEAAFSNKSYDSAGGYNITFVEEKDSGFRNLLLLGSFFLVTVATLGGVITSLYTSDAFVGSLNEDMVLLAPGTIDAPPEEPIEPEPPKAPSKQDAGGGGGGGKNEQTETSKGQLAPQMEKPLIAPSVTMDRVTKPSIPIQMATQGKANIPQTDEKYGNPNSLSTIPSDGTGSGGGQGSGVGRGQGSGRGTGAGSGIGSGLGSGIGDGIGDGSGSGVGGPPALKKPEPVGPTEAIKITAKPRANYTDAARQNQVQGTVTLRVTFLANGSIGSISAVNGLPNGLTEQAIAAARSIRFEPAKKGGVPYTVTKQVQYNFTLY